MNKPDAQSTMCCAVWGEAQRMGSDGEGYGRAIWDYGDGPMLGSISEPVAFCPWCGADKRKVRVAPTMPRSALPVVDQDSKNPFQQPAGSVPDGG